MTNYEKIKAMSVEEMANILVNPCSCCNAYEYSNCDVENCVVQIMKYLESEVEENMLPEICSCGYRFVADETICPNCGKKVEEDG